MVSAFIIFHFFINVILLEKGENMKQKKEKIEIISEPADITDIYFSTSKRFYKSRRLRIRYSNIYNCNEYYWHGMLRKNAQLCIKRKDGTTFPKFLNYEQQLL